MKVPKPINAEILDAATLAASRGVMAGILVVVRAHKQGKPVSAALQARLDRLTPQLYLWHWFAWKLGGFKEGVDLATTPDAKVVILGATEILYGDPLTEEVATIPFETTQVDVVETAVPESTAVVPVPSTNVEITTSAVLPTVHPKSAYRFH